MPVIGFKCNQTIKGTVSFDFCFKSCSNPCMPFPVLLAIKNQMREDEPGVYHVTSILNPPQSVYLARNNDLYVPPNSRVDMLLGTAWHAEIEKTKKYVKELGIEDDYLMEKNFVVPFWWDKTSNTLLTAGEVNGSDDQDIDEDSVILSGTSDLYVNSTATLWDYKVMKFFYTFKYLKEGKWEDSSIPWQMNIYRRFQYPTGKGLFPPKMKIFAYLKDYKSNFVDKYGVHQTEILEVPRIPDRVVDNKVRELLTEHYLAQKTGEYRPCTAEERWNDNIRCKLYCSVADICRQFQGESKGELK